MILPRPAVSLVPPAIFDTRVTLCAAIPVDDDGACADAELCNPLPDAAFAASACIWIADDVPCPAGSAYVERTLLHQDVDDSRGCTACVCGDIGGTCSATIELFSEQVCEGGSLGEIESGAACEAAGGTVFSARVVDLLPDASCGAPSGAQPVGSATPADPLTMCCAP